MNEAWPELRWADWRETAEALQLWTQVVGKVRLALAAPVNHWWHVTLYVSARGLTTSPMPVPEPGGGGGGSGGGRDIEIVFDFVAQRLVVACTDGGEAGFALKPMSVADFHAAVLAALAEVGVGPAIWPVPSERPDPVPFAQDTAVRAYDPAAAVRFWRVLVQAERVMAAFRGRFIGKCSPVHFFWGGFDLAVTRFSGRRAPAHPSVPVLPDFVVREAYSHEVSSGGFWPGDAAHEAQFYAYAYPEPPGFAAARVEPEAARWDAGLGEFVLPYAAVRAAADPDAALTAFLQSTYAAAADLAQWDRAALER